MYIDEINIKNLGPIENFYYKAQFDKDGRPVPIILVGKNGTGKTLLLSNIIDAFIEIKRGLFQHMDEVGPNKYYKIRSKDYIKNGKTSSFCETSFCDGNSKATQIDIVSYNPEKEIEDKVYSLEQIQNLENFKKNGFSHKKKNEFSEENFQKSIMLYFPADRFYIPHWYNNTNYKRINYDFENVVGSPRTNIIKTDLLNNIYSWLIDLFISTTYQSYYLPDKENIPVELRNKQINLPVNDQIQTMVQQIFNVIKEDNVSITRPNRKNKQVGIAGNCYDFSQMSSGEVWLYSLALSIVKEWDVLHQNDFKLSDIVGTVVVDEVDQSLHIDYIYNVLPQIMNLFPKVQFVFTGHSPFLLIGLQKHLNIKPNIIAMPNGAVVDSVNDYTEIAQAYTLFLEENEKAVKRKDAIEKELQNLQSKVNKLIVITEGKTDSVYLETSLSVLRIEDELKKKIVFWDFKNWPTLGDELCKIAKQFSSIPNANKIICIYDRDKHRVTNIDGKNYSYIKNGVYEMNIPAIETAERKIDDKICIENYFSNNEIKTLTPNGRLYMKDDFDEYGTSLDKCWSFKDFRKNAVLTDNSIIDGHCKQLEKKSDNARIITKEQFAEYVQQDPQKFNFENFKKIIDVIIEIDKDVEEDIK